MLELRDVSEIDHSRWGEISRKERYKHKKVSVPVRLRPTRETSASEVCAFLGRIRPLPSLGARRRLLKPGDDMQERKLTEVRILPDDRAELERVAADFGFEVIDSPLDIVGERQAREDRSRRHAAEKKARSQPKLSFV